jgi:hypothetical protein
MPFYVEQESGPNLRFLIHTKYRNTLASSRIIRSVLRNQPKMEVSI